MEIVHTMKLHLHADAKADELFNAASTCYASACNAISRYVFDHGFVLNYIKLQEQMYQTIRQDFGLKSQMTISAFKTVTARYKTVQEQLQKNPHRYTGETGKTVYIRRDLEWLQKPVIFSRPQIDLVRGRDYSFLADGVLSLNTLKKRVKVTYDVPEYFEKYFSGEWSFGTGKLVSLNGQWYFHIPMIREVPDTFDMEKPAHVVGIDRGLRFLMTIYDEKGRTRFFSGKDILNKRDRFNTIRAELQAKGTKSAKRALKRISGRENRWMSNVNHCLSKTLVDTYGAGTLFVMEDLTGVSFSEEALRSRDAHGRNELRSWTFYQLEQLLTYKAEAAGSEVLTIAADYTSQRCPKCGRIHKENRDHKHHLYTCDACGYRSNDDRVGAMNIYTLGTMRVSGDMNPRFGARKIN